MNEVAMIPGRIRALGVCILLVASCDSTSQTEDIVQASVAASSSTTTSIVTAPWAHEAQVFFDAFYLAGATGGAGWAEFFTTSAVFEDPSIKLLLEGRDEISRSRLLVAAPPGTQGVFVTTDRVATRVDVVPPGYPHYLLELESFHMRDGLIEYQFRELAVSMLDEHGFMTEDRTERLGALYEEYVTAWDSGESEQIEAVYRTGAARKDGLFGGSRVIGEDLPDSLPPHLSISAEGVRYRSVFGAVFTAPTNHDPTWAHALFDLIDGDGCRLRLLAEWELDDFLIVGEEIFYEIDSVRLCASALGLDPLPEGWWTGLELPDFLEEVTAQVPTNAGTTITVLNGGRRQIGLVKWGLQRFEQAGLTAPTPDVVAFPPTRSCAHGARTAKTVYGSEQTRVDMCLLQGDICIAPCDTMQAIARLTILHELAHVWERQNVDDATREAFLAQRGLDVWSEPSPSAAHDRSELGIEQAADMIAWGLLDEELLMVVIPDATPEDLQAGFRMLTGVDPIVRR